MKILVATQTKGGLEDLVSPVFGRAPTFTVVEVENKEIKDTKVHTNTAAAGFRGVGIQAAQFAANEKVNAVIAGNIGPYASSVLAQTGIEIATGFVGMKAKDAVDLYLKGRAPTYQMPSPAVPMQTPQYAHLVQTSKLEPKTSKIDMEFEKKMLELQKAMVEERIAYLDKKMKELEER